MTLAEQWTPSQRTSRWLLFAALAGVLVCITPNAKSNPFDGPMVVAQRMLHGDADLPANLTWMEGFPHEGRRYLAYPPMVTFLLVPYAALGGGALGQTAANSLLILGSAILLFALLRHIPGLESLAALGAVAWVTGTQLLYSAHYGHVWLLMHSEGNFFLLLALYLTIVRRSFFWAGLAFMVASLVRYAILFSAPAFVVLVLQHHRAERDGRAVVRSLLLFVLGGAIPLAIVLAYNAWIFGDPFKNPYVATWHQRSATWARRHASMMYTTFAIGAFGPRNVARNLVFYLTAQPAHVPWRPYFRFTGRGESILLLSPFFVGLFFANFQIRAVRAFAAGALAMFVFYLLYSYQGYVQFGSRYMSDLFPFLVPLALSGFARPSRAWRVVLAALIAAAIAINAYGVWVVSSYGLGPPKVWKLPRHADRPPPSAPAGGRPGGTTR